ncbi:hypothetical protein AA313_de0202217 [Arthrobotrys entomopaga]|nr:hypothetical protein AA313_de0202217 [Arthrobotrys entomopaga]
MVSSSKLWAVLIGIDYYIPKSDTGEHSAGPTYRQLAGCVRDVNQIEKLLRCIAANSRSGLELANIATLISSARHCERDRAENLKDLNFPVHDNIIRELDKITKDARPDDVIYIHYSGHGSNRRTLKKYNQKPENAGYNESGSGTALALADAMIGGKYLFGYDLGIIIQNMVEKRLRVTLILDSCFSGRGVRQNDIELYTPRHGDDEGSCNDEDSGPEPLCDDESETRNGGSDDGGNFGAAQVDSDDGSDFGAARMDSDGGSDFGRTEEGEFKDDIFDELRDLIGSENYDLSSGGRNAENKTSWLSSPTGCTFLTACQGNQTAGEYVFKEGTYGVFTYWMLSLLYRTYREVLPTYSKVRDYAELKIKGMDWTHKQSPVIHGDSDYLFLRNKQVFEKPQCQIIQKTGKILTLNVGLAQGAAAGAVYKIYPAYKDERSESIKPWKAIITRVNENSPFESRAELQTQGSNGDSTITETSGVVLHKWALPNATTIGASFQCKVDEWQRLERELEMPPKMTLKQSLEKREHQFFARVKKAGAIEIFENGALLHRIPIIRLKDKDWIEKFSYTIRHIARYRALMDVHISNPSATFQREWFSIGVEKDLIPTHSNEESIDDDTRPTGSDENIFRDPNEIYVVKTGTHLNFSIKLTKKYPNQSAYASFYSFSGTWGISQAYPAGQAYIQLINSDHELESFKLKMYIPERGYGRDPTDIFDTLRLVISTSPINMGEITLPELPLDPPSVHSDTSLAPGIALFPKDRDSGDNSSTREHGGRSDTSERNAKLVSDVSNSTGPKATVSGWMVSDQKIRVIP